MKTPICLLLFFLPIVPASAEGHWSYRTTNYERRLNTPGPKSDIRGRFSGQGITINSSFHDAQDKACHTKFLATWNWSHPSQSLTPKTKLKFVVSTDASHENWPYPTGSANVWVDGAYKVVEFGRTKPAGPQSGEGILEVPEGEREGHDNLTIGFHASNHSGEMSIVHVYKWAEGPPPPGNALATPPLPADNPPPAPSDLLPSVSLSGRWTGSWRNSMGESGADTLELQEDAAGKLAGTWSGTVPVSGRRIDASHIQMQGRTATRDFQIQGILQDGTLKLTYVARRLNSSGSYKGEATFKR